MSRRRVDLCCLQETRWRNAGTRKIEGKDSQFKLFWSGNEKGTGGVGVLLAEKWWEKIYDVQRVCDRILLVRLVIGKVACAFLCVYAPQSGLNDELKDRFYEQLQSVVAKIPDSEQLFINGDWNGHIGSDRTGFEEVHGGHALGQRNPEGERILEFAVANNLVIGNSVFQKKERHLVTFQSGTSESQIDYILYRRSFRKHVTNVKVICGEECASQHMLVTADFTLHAPAPRKRKFVPKIKMWKMKDPATRAEFTNVFSTKSEGIEANTVEEKWKALKGCLIQSAEQVCGLSSKHQWRKQTWWWNDLVETAVSEKRRCYKAWKAGGSRAEYNTAKRVARRAVYHAKNEAQKVVLENIDPKAADIFKLAKQMKRDNQDVVGEKPVKNDAGELSLDEDAMKSAWKEHYERLLNVEFPWNPEDLSVESPVEGPSEEITSKMISNAINKMGMGKAAGPSGIVAEMLKPTGEAGIALVKDLVEAIVRVGHMPKEWQESYIVSLFKGKGDALNRGNYRGLKLIDQVMKVLERMAEQFIRQKVRIDDMQFGFMPGRGTTDAIFIARQMQEKYQAANKTLYFAFIDLEKAFDRVPREVIWWAMRKVGIDEWLVRLVQSMYSDVRSRVRVGDGYSDEFPVGVGVHQGSVLSPLLFIIVLEALSQEFRTGCPWELLYADDLVIIAESLEELIIKIDKWKNGMEKKGLRVNMAKTKVLISGPDLDALRESGKYPCAVCLKGTGNNSIICNTCSRWVHKKCSGLQGTLKPDPSFICPRCQGTSRPVDGRPAREVEVKEEKLEAVADFCYLGDALSAGGGCELAAITRCNSAWKKFRELLPILTNRHLPSETRGRVYAACIRSVMLYGSETWAASSSTQKRLQRNDRAMLRWMHGLKPDEVVSTDTLIAKFRLKTIQDALRANRLRWLGHVERSSSWISRVRDIEVHAVKSRGRPKLTWDEVVKRDRASLHMDSIDPEDRHAWRERLRTRLGRQAAPS
jgi:exonuclease III